MWGPLVLGLAVLVGAAAIASVARSARLSRHLEQVSRSGDLDRPAAVAARLLTALQHLHSAALDRDRPVAGRFVSRVRTELAGALDPTDLTLFDQYRAAIGRVRRSRSAAAREALRRAHNQFIGERGRGGPAHLIAASLGRDELERVWRRFSASLHLYHVTSSLFLRRIGERGLSVAALPPGIAAAIADASAVYRRCGLVREGRLDVVDDLGRRPIFCRATPDLIDDPSRYAAASALPAFAYELLDEAHARRHDWLRRVSDADLPVLARCWRVGRLVRHFNRMVGLRIRVGDELLRREGVGDVIGDLDRFRRLVFAPHVNHLLLDEIPDGPAGPVLVPDPRRSLPELFSGAKQFGLDIPVHQPVPVSEIDVQVWRSDRAAKQWLPLTELAHLDRVVALGGDPVPA